VKDEIKKFLSFSRERNYASVIPEIVSISDIYVMKPGTAIMIDAGTPHAVLTILPKTIDDNILIFFYGYVGNTIGPDGRKLLKKLNYK
jgi:hypothetical protein